jgi:hypothetical protein
MIRQAMRWSHFLCKDEFTLSKGGDSYKSGRRNPPKNQGGEILLKIKEEKSS